MDRYCLFLFRRVGFCRYASRFQHFELFLVDHGSSTLNYADHYSGVYIGFEKIKRIKSRVNVSKPASPEPVPFVNTAGYIIKIDRACDQPGCQEAYYKGPAFTSTVVIDYPDPITPNQQKYVTGIDIPIV